MKHRIYFKRKILLSSLLVIVGCGNKTAQVDSGGVGTPENVEMVEVSDLGNESRVAEIIEMVNSIEKLLPANTWDSEVLKSISYNQKENAVELTFSIPSEKPKNINNAEQSDLNEAGIFYIYQFKKGYTYKGKGEGDPELYKEMLPMFKATVRKEVNIRFNFIFYGDEKFTFKITPKYTEKAVLKNVERRGYKELDESTDEDYDVAE